MYDIDCWTHGGDLPAAHWRSSAGAGSTVTAEAGGAGVKTTLEDCFVLLERLYLHMLGSNQALFKFSFLHLSLSSLR